MGLSKLWSSITGPKVKEITPQEKCSWLEHPRPVTSNGTRLTKSHISLPLLADTLDANKLSPQTVTSDDKSSIFRKKSRWRRRRSQSGARITPVVADAPDVPDLVAVELKDVPILARGPSVETDTIELPSRPASAITIDAIDAAASANNLASELPAESTIVPTAKPKTPEKDAPLPTVTRIRSKSLTATDKPRQKRASWYSLSRRKPEDLSAALPPLPTPEIPVPSPPRDVPTTSAQLSPLSSPITTSDPPMLPPTQNFRSSLGAASILAAFPSVPSPNLSVDTPASPPPRDSGVVTRSNTVYTSKPLPDPQNNRPLPSPKSFSKPLSPSSPITADFPFPAITASNRSSAHRRSASATADLTPEQRREYNRVTAFLDSKHTSGGVVSVVTAPPLPITKHDVGATSPEAKPDSALEPVDADQKFSNDAALAALEFGIENWRAPAPEAQSPVSPSVVVREHDADGMEAFCWG